MGILFPFIIMYQFHRRSDIQTVQKIDTNQKCVRFLSGHISMSEDKLLQVSKYANVYLFIFLLVFETSQTSITIRETMFRLQTKFAIHIIYVSS